MSRFGSLFAIVTAASVSACASNAFVSTWTAPDAVPLHVSGTKVAAIVMMKEESSRRAAEDALARELAAQGASGVPLYTVLPEARPDNEAQVRAAMEQAGVEGAVVMRPVRTETEVVSQPLIYTRLPYGAFWNGYYGFGWGAPWDFGLGLNRGVVVGGEVYTYTVVSVETLVYSLRQNKLVWAGQSQTTDPATVDQLIKDTARKVARELKSQGLIAPAEG